MNCEHIELPDNYMAREEYARGLMKTHKQKLCNVCNRWAIWELKIKPGMQPLTKHDQLQVGTNLMIVGKKPWNSYGSISVKKLQTVTWDAGETNIEAILNLTKNRYFNVDLYFKGESSWVKEVYVLEGKDKRLKAAR